MRKAPALLASALLLSTIAAGVGPMMAAAAAHAESPQPSIEVTERDEDDLDITVFSGVITNGRDYLNLSRGHNNIPSQPTPKSVVFGPSAAKVASLQTDSGVTAQEVLAHIGRGFSGKGRKRNRRNGRIHPKGKHPAIHGQDHQEG